MRIGFDLDNTIINYDKSYSHYFSKKKSLKKIDIKKILFEKKLVKSWQSLQEKVYSKGLNQASCYPGVINFLYFLEKNKINFYIVSHKTKKPYTGKKIDLRARKFLKKDGLDYAHGTGHGVGFFLNVHEGPQSISKFNSVKLEEGMVLSNEPGYYKKGHYGIRIENLVFIKKSKNTLSFENLTLAPLEKDLINYDLLNKNEKDYLFKYHLKIYETYSRFLNLDERKWLASLI